MVAPCSDVSIVVFVENAIQNMGTCRCTGTSHDDVSGRPISFTHYYLTHARVRLIDSDYCSHCMVSRVCTCTYIQVHASVDSTSHPISLVSQITFFLNYLYLSLTYVLLRFARVPTKNHESCVDFGPERMDLIEKQHKIWRKVV